MTFKINCYQFLTSSLLKEKEIQKRRIVAGAKGIGRFSCDRLGSILNIHTKKEDEEVVHHVSIDWSKLEEDQAWHKHMELTYRRHLSFFETLQLIGLHSLKLEIVNL